ncbi:MAG: flavodoxin family protein [Clostridiales bacterium]|nr:flavodoxin family protein [Clostridiales bacterium]
MMKVCVLLGNTRKRSNTEAVTRVFMEELAAKGAEVKAVALREKNIQPCVGCDACHGALDSFGCAIDDDMHEIAEEVLSADLLVFSSPIYSWFATPLIKTVMDRLYAFTKYPKGADPFCLMRDMSFALIATSGDECADNCDLLDEAIRRMAKFTGVPYLGYFAVQDKGYENNAREEAVNGARAFAEKCISGM